MNNLNTWTIFKFTDPRLCLGSLRPPPRFGRYKLLGRSTETLWDFKLLVTKLDLNYSFVTLFRSESIYKMTGLEKFFQFKCFLFFSSRSFFTTFLWNLIWFFCIVGLCYSSKINLGLNFSFNFDSLKSSVDSFDFMPEI